ncbi:MAG: hypothetical protein II888_07400, partial [Clostridia bacterium]|nr:hypothetical protein [Clostridia bacterium]
MIEWPRDETRQSEGGISPKRMDQRFLVFGISVDRKGPRKTARGPFHSVPGMAQFSRVKVPPRVFTAKCSEPQAATSNGRRGGSG